MTTPAVVIHTDVGQALPGRAKDRRKGSPAVVGTNSRPGRGTVNRRDTTAADPNNHPRTAADPSNTARTEPDLSNHPRTAVAPSNRRPNPLPTGHTMKTLE